MSRFLFVHGAWHGAWCWYKVLAHLERDRHVAHAIDLPGHGRDRTPLAGVTMQAYVDAVAAEIDASPEPVTLVGHSMGGAVITQVGEMRPEKIRTLVYVAAFLPQPGECVMGLFQQAAGSALVQAAVPSADGSELTVPEHAMKECLYGMSPAEDLHLARLCLTPQAMAPGVAPIQTTPARFGTIPRVYVETLRDFTLPIEDQRRMVNAQPCRAVYSLQSDHSPFFSAPAELVRILEGL